MLAVDQCAAAVVHEEKRFSLANVSTAMSNDKSRSQNPFSCCLTQVSINVGRFRV